MFDEIAEPLCSVVPAFFFICRYHYDDGDNCVEVSFEWNIHLLTTGRFIKYLLVSLRKWLLSGRICTASRFDTLCIQRCCSARLFRNYLSCSCLLISLPPLCSFSTGLFLGSSWVNERDERWLSIKSLFVKHSGCRPAIATVPQSH